MARILVVCEDVPYPPVGGGRMRVWAILARLASAHRVVVVCNDRHGDAVAARSALREIGVGSSIVTRPKSRSMLLKGAEVTSYVFSRLPPAFALYTSGTFRRAFEAAVKQQRPDLIIFEDESVALPIMRRSGVPNSAVPYAIDLLNLYSRSFYGAESNSRQRQPGRFIANLTGRRLERFERALFAAAAFVSCCSKIDGHDARRLGANRVVFAPNAVDVGSIRPLGRPSAPRVGYLGTLSSPPNVEASLELIHKLYPLVRNAVPSCTLLIAGRHPPQALAAACKGQQGVTLLDSPPHVDEFYQSVSVVVVPLHEGGGTRLKILEAMAYGRPVVSTSLGAEGIEGADSGAIRITDDPSEMATATVTLLNDERAWQEASRAGRRLVESRYDWSAALRPLQDEVASRAVQN